MLQHKRQKWLWLTVVLVAIVTGAAIPSNNATFAQGGRNQQAKCGEPVVVTLWAGQSTESGYVAVQNDSDNLTVQFYTTGGWTLTGTHLHIATSLDGIPVNDQGVPVPGQFDYSASHANITSYTYTIPLAWDDAASLVIAAHATVALLDSDGEVVQAETAWGGDEPGEGARWWYYIEFAVQDCTETEDEDTAEGEGCTPGYWRNHTDDWEQTGYDPDQMVNSVFASVPDDLADDTLLDAVKYATKGKGKDSTIGAARVLLRAGVAALLNATHADVDYPHTGSAVITTVNGALASDNRSVMLAVAGALDDDNNLGCSLNGTNSTGNGNKPENPGQGNKKDDDLEQGQPLEPGNGNGKKPGKPENPGNGKGKRPD